jgi:uncharacterized membrane protein YphA (DoxX/SURF4 family)
MKNLKIIAKIFYGLGIAGIGILHFMYAGFRPVILPVPPEATADLVILVYLIGMFLFIAGLAIASGKWVKPFALLLGVVLLLFFLFGHLPNRLMNMPTVLGVWTDALKILALSGGAFIIASTFPGYINSKLFTALDKLSFLGKYFYGIMLVIFGIDHFLYTDFVKTLVPLWIPGNIFWTYVAGIALIGAGLSFIINFKVKPISMLTGAMLFIWLILLHIPRSFAADNSTDPNEIVSVFECLAFSGMAFLLWFKTEVSFDSIS